jgi:hypothetical protein
MAEAATAMNIVVVADIFFEKEEKKEADPSGRVV